MTAARALLANAVFAAMDAGGHDHLRVAYASADDHLLLTEIWQVDSQDRPLIWLNPPGTTPSADDLMLFEPVTALCLMVLRVPGVPHYRPGTGRIRLPARTTQMIHDHTDPPQPRRRAQRRPAAGKRPGRDVTG
jgi:hypothetical protein